MNWALVLAPLLAAACSSGEGSPCSREGEGRCLAPDQSLVCQGGTWIRVPCRGPLGCSATHELRCDQHVAHEGDACRPFGQRSCDDGKRAVLACMQATGRWTREAACSGPRGCEDPGAALTCDDSQAHAGELCVRDGQRACAVDGQALLQCQDGRFASVKSCAHCTQVDAGLQCD